MLLAIATLVVLGACLPVAGIAYQAIGAALDRKRLIAADTLLPMGNGRLLHIVQHGRRTDDPTVVFESGFAATGLNWVNIQRAIASTAHTVTYDRYGLGWTSPATTPRTPSVIAAEMREMLQQAGVEPPYLLVGHSFGGLVVRRFALDFPREVAGLVLVDPMRPGDWPPASTHQQPAVDHAHRLARRAVPFARFGIARLAAQSLLCRSNAVSNLLVRLGGHGGRHLAGRLTTEVGKMPDGIRPALAAHWSSPHFYRGLVAQLDGLHATVVEMQDAPPLTAVPVTLLTPACATRLTDAEKLAFGPLVQETIAEHSRHWVHLDEPQLVINVILHTLTQRSPCEPQPLQPLTDLAYESMEGLHA